MDLAVMAGLAFVAGILSFTSPCCLPLMPGHASYISAARSDGTPTTDASLGIYALGLGVPFVGLAVAATRLQPVTTWLRRHARGVELSGAAVLVTMGVLLLTNQWLRFVAPLTRLFTDLGWPPL